MSCTTGDVTPYNGRRNRYQPLLNIGSGRQVSGKGLYKSRHSSTADDHRKARKMSAESSRTSTPGRSRGWTVRSEKSGPINDLGAAPVRVCVRFRPLTRRQKEAGVHWKIEEDGHIQHYTRYGGEVVVDEARTYRFKNVFGSALTSSKAEPNEKLYEAVCSELVDRAIHGFNGCLLAYGQSNTGKTHTMFGTKNVPGVVFLCIDDLFKHIEKDKSREYLLRCTFVEIYKEEFRDLLDESIFEEDAPQDARAKAARPRKVLLQEIDKEIKLANASEHVLFSAEQAKRVVLMGFSRRSVAATPQNPQSTRSHCVCRIQVESRAVLSNFDASDTTSISDMTDVSDVAMQKLTSELMIIDFGGMERAGAMKMSDKKKQEGIVVNKGLLTFYRVVQNLSSWSRSLKKNPKRPKPHVPYRDSKLTRILQHAIGGNSYLGFIATVSALEQDVQETAYTLDLARQVSYIRNDPFANEKKEELPEMEAMKHRIMELEKELHARSDRLKAIDRWHSALFRLGVRRPSQSDSVSEASTQNTAESERARSLNAEIDRESASTNVQLRVLRNWQTTLLRKQMLKKQSSLSKLGSSNRKAEQVRQEVEAIRNELISMKGEGGGFDEDEVRKSGDSGALETYRQAIVMSASEDEEDTEEPEKITVEEFVEQLGTPPRSMPASTSNSPTKRKMSTLSLRNWKLLIYHMLLRHGILRANSVEIEKNEALANASAASAAMKWSGLVHKKKQGQSEGMVASLKEQIENMKMDRETLLDEQRQLEEAHEKALEEMGSAMKVLEDEKSIQEAVVVEKESQVADLSKSLEDQQSEMEKLKSELESSQSALSTSESDAQNMQDQLEKQTARVSELEAELSALSSEANQLKSSASDANAEMDVEVRKLASSVHGLGEKTGTADDADWDIKEKDPLVIVRLLLVAVNKASDSVSDSLSELASQSQELQDAIQKVQQLQTDLTARDASVAELQQSVELSKQDAADAKQQLQDAESTITDLESRLKVMSTDVEKARADGDSKESALQKRDEMLEKLREEMTAAASKHQEVLDSRNDTIATLEQELETVKGLSGDLEEKLSAATASRTTSDAEAEQLRKRIDELQQALDSAQSDAASNVQAEKAAADDAQKALRKQIESLQKDIDSLTQESADLKEKYDKSSSSLQEEQTANTNLRQKLEELQSQLGDSQKQYQQLHNSHEELSTSCSDLTSKIASITESWDSTKNVLSSTESALKTASTDLDAEKERSTGLEKRAGDLQSQVEGLEGNNSDLLAQVEDLKKEQGASSAALAASQTEVERLQAALSNLEAELSEVSSRKASLESEIGILKQSGGDLEQSILQLQSDVDERQQAADAKALELSALSKERDDLLADRTSLMSELNTLKAEKEAQVVAFSELSEQKGKLDTELQEQQEASATLQAEIEGMKVAATDRSNMISKLQSQLRDLREQSSLMDSVREENEMLKMQNEDKDVAVQELTAKLNQEAASAHSWELKHSSLQSDLDKRSLELEELSARIKNFESSADSTAAVTEDLRLQLTSRDAAIKELEAKLSHLQASADTVSEESRERIAELERSIEASNGDRMKAEAELADRESRISELTTQTDGNEERIAFLEKQLRDTEESVDGLKSDLASAESKYTTASDAIEDLRRQIADRETRISGLSERSDKNEEAIASLEKQLRDAEASANGLKNELASAESKHTSVSDEIEELRTQVADRESRISELTKRSEKNEEAIASLEKQLHEAEASTNGLKNDLASVETKHTSASDAIEDLRAQISRLEEERRQLQEELETSKADSFRAQGESESASNEVAELRKKQKELASELDAIKAERDDMLSSMQQLEELQNRMLSAQDVMNKHEHDMELVNQKLEDKRLQVEELKKSLRSTGEEHEIALNNALNDKDALAAQVSSLLSDNESLRKSVEDLQAQVNAAHDKHEDHVSDLSKQISDGEESTARRVQELEDRIEYLQKALDSERELAAESNQALDVERRGSMALKEKVDTLTDSVNCKDEEITRSHIEASNFRSEASSLNKKLAELKKRMEAMEKDRLQLRETLLSEVKPEVAQNVAGLHSLKSQVHDHIAPPLTTIVMQVLTEYNSMDASPVLQAAPIAKSAVADENGDDYPVDVDMCEKLRIRTEEIERQKALIERLTQTVNENLIVNGMDSATFERVSDLEAENLRYKNENRALKDDLNRVQSQLNDERKLGKSPMAAPDYDDDDPHGSTKRRLDRKPLLDDKHESYSTMPPSGGVTSPKRATPQRMCNGMNWVLVGCLLLSWGVIAFQAYELNDK